MKKSITALILFALLLFIAFYGWAGPQISTPPASDTAYNATSWDGVTGIAPSKNAVRDKIENIVGGNIANVVASNNGTANNLTVSNYTMNGQIITGVYNAGTCTTAYTVIPTNGAIQKLALNGACAVNVANVSAGLSFILQLYQGSTVAANLSTSQFTWTAGAQPSWSTTAGKKDLVSCVSVDGTSLSAGALLDVRLP